jgi:hypothetical protein
MSSSKVSDLMKNQKLFSNKELMSRNLQQLCVNMQECENYIQSVIDGKRQADPEVSRALN